jgi:hypothetical protein
MTCNEIYSMTNISIWILQKALITPSLPILRIQYSGMLMQWCTEAPYFGPNSATQSIWRKPSGQMENCSQMRNLYWLLSQA